MDDTNAPEQGGLLHPVERAETDAQRVFGDAMTLPEQRKALRKEAAIEMMSFGVSMSEIAEAIGVDRATFFRWRKDDPEFNAKLHAKLVINKDMLQAEAERRALRGSDKLLMFLLERYDPEKFHLAQKLEHSGAVDLASAVLAGRRRTGADSEPGSDLC